MVRLNFAKNWYSCTVRAFSEGTSTVHWYVVYMYILNVLAYRTMQVRYATKTATR